MDKLTDHVYPEVYGNRIEGNDAPPPNFPSNCPCCGAETVGTEWGDTFWPTHIYACGGKYKPKPQTQRDSYIWWGYCEKTRLCNLVGLANNVPDEVLHDALIDADRDPGTGKLLGC